MRSRNGFTLIELVTVIIILSILALTVTVKWPSKVINLNAQTKAFVADIRHTQNLSATRGIRYYLIITSATTYTIRDFNGNNGENYVLGSSITFGTLTNLPNSLIAFDGQGTPYSNTSIPGTALAGNATITLNSSDGSSKIVTITQITGQVSP
jgi:prepilin-type N-terminal cleavage/methylation domain-containing protein